MKQTTRGNLAKAYAEAARLNLKMVSKGGPGSIRRWSNGRWEVLYVPDHAYSGEGSVTVRSLGRIKP